MPRITLFITQAIDIKKPKVMEALHAVRNLILYAHDPDNMSMDLKDRAKREVCRMFRCRNKPIDQHPEYLVHYCYEGIRTLIL